MPEWITVACMARTCWLNHSGASGVQLHTALQSHRASLRAGGRAVEYQAEREDSHTATGGHEASEG